MSSGDNIDWDALWNLASKRFTLGLGSIHGPHHWRRVEQNALQLAVENRADVTVVRLFAMFHDSCRENDSHDPEHGLRAARWAASLHGTAFSIDHARLETLTEACIGHDKGYTSPDMTIGTCWDADRLELTRVGVRPDPAYMSTAAGRALAARGWPYVR
jgi:uncharacterized protein